MKRSKWKGPYVNENILNKTLTKTFLQTKTKVIKTMSKNSEIIYNFIGLTFNIYNGKTFLNLEITKKMVGHKLGEFIFTRSHSPPKKKKVKKKISFKKNK